MMVSFFYKEFYSNRRNLAHLHSNIWQNNQSFVVCESSDTLGRWYKKMEWDNIEQMINFPSDHLPFKYNVNDIC